MIPNGRWMRMQTGNNKYSKWNATDWVHSLLWSFQKQVDFSVLFFFLHFFFDIRAAFSVYFTNKCFNICSIFIWDPNPFILLLFLFFFSSLLIIIIRSNTFAIKGIPGEGKKNWIENEFVCGCSFCICVDGIWFFQFYAFCMHVALLYYWLWPCSSAGCQHKHEYCVDADTYIYCQNHLGKMKMWTEKLLILALNCTHTIHVETQDKNSSHTYILDTFLLLF